MHNKREKLKRRMFYFFEGSFSIYDDGHTAKTQHHILKYKRVVFSLNFGLNIYFLLQI